MALAAFRTRLRESHARASFHARLPTLVAAEDARYFGRAARANACIQRDKYGASVEHFDRRP